MAPRKTISNNVHQNANLTRKDTILICASLAGVLVSILQFAFTALLKLSQTATPSTLFMVTTCCSHARAATQAAASDREVLPANVRPSHYDLLIAPNPAIFSPEKEVKVEEFTFNGQVSIVVSVEEDTDCVCVNSSELEIRSVELIINESEKYNCFCRV